MITATADLLDIRKWYGQDILTSSNFGYDGQYIARVGWYISELPF